MNLEFILKIVEKAKSERVTDIFLDGYEYCIAKVLKKYPDYYRDKKYAKPFIK